MRAPLRQRSSLLARFGIISFVLLAVLGAVLVVRLQTVVRERTISDAIATASVAARTGVALGLEPQRLEQGFVPLSPQDVALLDARLRPALAADEVARLKVWNSEHWIVYSDKPELIGRWFVPDAGLSAALSGTPSSSLTSLRAAENLEERDFRSMISVYVPMRVDATGHYTELATGRVIGAAEIYVPYGPIAARARRDGGRLAILVVVGLLVLYLALFRLVAAASRRLRRQAEQNRHQAMHDSLTGLANRTQFVEQLDAVLGRSRFDDVRSAVALVDIDRFKEVNDTLGHGSGDRVLIALAQRLVAWLPSGVTVARLGGDEFAVMVELVEQPEQAVALAREIRSILAAPIKLGDGLSLEVHGSVGVALSPEHGDSAEVLLQRADVAMYVAKRGQTGVEVYRPSLDHYSPERLQLAGEVRDAIDRREFFLAYQPKLDLRSEIVTGVEALVRWRHPTRGLVSPADFVPGVENTHLAGPLTAYVLEEAMAACRRWLDAGLSLHVAVNVPARCLVDRGLVADVSAALTRHRVAPEHLELELTESSLLADAGRARATLLELRALGVTVAIDDFGTGYASIPYLIDLPVNVVKIDQSFVGHLHDDPQAAAVTRFSIDLAHGLGLQAVAEGVEDAGTLASLTALGCDVIQGYHLARPMPEADLLAWVRGNGIRVKSSGDIPVEVGR